MYGPDSPRVDPGRSTAGPGPGGGLVEALTREFAPGDDDDVALKDLLGRIRGFRGRFTRFMLSYQFGIEEVTTKLEILRREFEHSHASNPIQHLASRLKSPQSVLDKAEGLACEPTLDAIRGAITDIAGVRVICSFVSDVYRVQDLLCGQKDLRVIKVKDYIAHPKANGYRSLHALVEVPVFLSDGVVDVPVEVQFRTIAMDFWASLEHKIYYKHDRDVPAALLADLGDAASTAARLDVEMERLHDEIRGPNGYGANGYGANVYGANIVPGGEVSDEAILAFLRKVLGE